MKFSRLASYFERIAATSKRLEMFDILAELFLETDARNIDKVIYFCQEQLAPPFHAIDLGMSEKYVIRTISDAAGTPTQQVEALFSELGDLGLVAESLMNREGGLSVSQVYGELVTIAESSGKGSINRKIELLGSLLKGLSPMEARYVIRFVIGSLRLGIGDPTLLEAMAHAHTCNSLGLPVQGVQGQAMTKQERLALFDSIHKSEDVLREVDTELAADKAGKATAQKEDVLNNKRATLYFQKLMQRRQAIRGPLERAYNLCSDLAMVARTFKTEGLEAVKNFKIKTGYPIKMALCERLPSSTAIINKLGKLAVEAKYDGIRCQVHKDGHQVDIFSRNLERMTHMFPEIVSATMALETESIILEGEALAFNEDTGELLPFQVTMQRRRKHDVQDKAREFPLKFFAFELLYLDGADYTPRPYIERHGKLKELIQSSASAQSTIEPANMFLTDNPAEIDRHFDEFIEVGLEGIVTKRLDAPYIAGARNFNWIKLKRSYKGELADSVDICIIGYFKGKGTRTKFGLGALLGAVYDAPSDTFKSISKIGTGFTQEALAQYRDILEADALDHKHPRVDSDLSPDVWVKPHYVITVTADEITRSPLHTAGRDNTGMGYALRFPRVVGMPRPDKSPEDANTVGEIITLAKMQKEVKAR